MSKLYQKVFPFLLQLACDVERVSEIMGSAVLASKGVSLIGHCLKWAVTVAQQCDTITL